MLETGAFPGVGRRLAWCARRSDNSRGIGGGLLAHGTTMKPNRLFNQHVVNKIVDNMLVSCAVWR